LAFRVSRSGSANAAPHSFADARAHCRIRHCNFRALRDALTDSIARHAAFYEGAVLGSSVRGPMASLGGVQPLARFQAVMSATFHV
jgi:hypothetical protein